MTNRAVLQAGDLISPSTRKALLLLGVAAVALSTFGLIAGVIVGVMTRDEGPGPAAAPNEESDSSRPPSRARDSSNKPASPAGADCANPLSPPEAAAVVRKQEGQPYGRWVPVTRRSAPMLKDAYDPSLDLSAVVGLTPGATGSSPVQVFLFHQGCYLGTTTKDSRVSLTVEQARGDTVVVRYSRYEAGDPTCCPSLPDDVVRYRWNGSKVVPLDPIPPRGQGLD